VRFHILQLLADRERFGTTKNHCCPEEVVCVCRLLMAIDISPPALSHHLKILRKAHLVESRKLGIWTCYSIRPGVLPIVIDALVQLEPETGSS
jgi:ArsR family transcriptional regulator